MKCICGYEYIKTEDKPESKTDQKTGDIPFIRITPKPTHAEILANIDYIYVQYACPKCKTIRLGD